MQDKTFFADKSKFIPLVEKMSNIVFTRPRRFGKSLVLQMRMCYYDKKNAGDNEFDKVCSSLILLFFVLSLQTSIQLSLFSLSMQLFGSLWIREKGPDGKHPHKTEDQGKYVILDIDFGPKKEPTQFNTDEEYAARFVVIILESIRECVDKYGLTLPASVLGVTTDPASALKNFCMAAGSTPIFAFTDEYDTPFNNLVLRSPLSLDDKERAMLPLKANFNSFLRALKSQNVRNFMTGVPNIHITAMTMFRTNFSPDWHALSDYTEKDVKTLLAQVRSQR